MTWVDLPEGTGFGIGNLPLGVFLGGGRPGFRHGVRVGDLVLDLFGVTGLPVHRTGTLDPFLAAGPGAWRDLREQVTEWLTDERHRARVEPHLLPIDAVRLFRPIGVANFVDFYSSRAHAENVGRLFRPGADPLPPNWLHLPIGYHGRAGTVQVSGTPVIRPCGQLGPPTDGPPPFGPTRRLDLEAEVGFVVGAPSEPGSRVPVEAFAEHVVGVCLVNDWSARDVQAWEYQPLGPFLGKSFATSMSPWIVPLAALEAARVPPPVRETALLPYLRDEAAPWGLDVELDVRINGEVVSRPPFRDMYWTPAQQLAHLTVNGASLLPGELFASGTVSGSVPGQEGSLLELTANGTRPLTLADGSTRTFLEDGDTVRITASAPGPAGTRIGLGEVTGQVLPAR
ncbi:fumarylacetoacetase [Blastococcus sp. SYSU D00922]